MELKLISKYEEINIPLLKEVLGYEESILYNKEHYVIKIVSDDGETISSDFSVYINAIDNNNKVDVEDCFLKGYYAYIKFVIIMCDGSIFETNFINVCVEVTLYEEYIYPMIEYICNNDKYFPINIETFNSFINSHPNIQDINDYWDDTMSLYKKIIKQYVKLYPEFQHQKAYEITQTYQYNDFYKSRKTDMIVCRDILTHPDELIEVRCGGIKHNNKFYIPQKIQQNVTCRNYNIYENKLVLSFLWHVIVSLKKKYDRILLDFNNKSKRRQLKENYVSVPAQIETIAYKKYMEPKLKQIRELCNQMYDVFYMYQNCLQCHHDICMDTIPQPTLLILQKNIYLEIYYLMQQFYHPPKFNISSIYKAYLELCQDWVLYERYVLCKILKHIEERCNKSCSYKNDIYSFKTNNQAIRVRYQCNIYTDIRKNAENKLYMYRNTYWKIDKDNWWAKEDKTINYYSPDFVVEIENSEQVKYIIFDAKFANWKNVCTYEIKDVFIKYGVCIGIMPRSDKEVVIDKVGIIYGKSEDARDIFVLNNSEYNKSSKKYEAYYLNPLNEGQHDALLDLLIEIENHIE